MCVVVVGLLLWSLVFVWCVNHVVVVCVCCCLCVCVVMSVVDTCCVVMCVV